MKPAPDSAPVASRPGAVVPSAPASRPRGGVDPSRAARAFLVGAVLVLEALPVAVWLAVRADVDNVPHPPALAFGGVLGVLLFAYGVVLALGRIGGYAAGSAAGRARSGQMWLWGWLRAFLLLGAFALSLVVVWWLSPVAYGGAAPLDAAQALARDFSGAGGSGEGLLGLFVVLVYLWWRGFSVARSALDSTAVSRRFVIGLTAIIVAVAAVATLTGTARDDLEAMLALALPFEVFVGLFASALAHALEVELRDAARRRSSRVGGFQGFSRPWLGIMLSVSGGVVVLALLVSLLVSVRGLRALLALLAPVVAVINALLEAVAFIIAYVLYYILSGLLDWFGHIVGHSSISAPQGPLNCNASVKNVSCHPHPLGTHGIPQAWLMVGHWLLVALVVLVVLLVLVRVLSGMRQPGRTRSYEEERSSLDARALLGQQLRNLFRRREHAEGEAEETLPPGSVRALYRGLLRGARRAGYSRWPEETPREYAGRLAALAGVDLPAGALEVLTRAYYPARYAVPAVQEEAPPEVRAAVDEVTRWLAAHPAGNAARRESARPA